jgi:hypothetical protein
LIWPPPVHTIVPSKILPPPVRPRGAFMFPKNCWYVAAWDHELIDALPEQLRGRRQHHLGVAAQEPDRRLHGDKHIVEAQQRAMDEDPDFKLLAVIADAPLAFPAHARSADRQGRG